MRTGGADLPGTPAIFTVGHGTRTTDELVQVLRGAHVTVLADVRRFPASRRHPHFGRERLEEELPSNGVGYEWWGETLGGRRNRTARADHPVWRHPSFAAYAEHMQTAVFVQAVSALEQLARVRTVAIMCSETVWWRCHRRMIADALVLSGTQVVHVGISRPQPHQAHEAARLTPEGAVVYDVGVTPPLQL